MSVVVQPPVACLRDALDDLSARFIVNCPNEELESFERMFFQIEEAHWLYVDFYVPMYKLPKLKLVAFTKALFDHCPSLQPHKAQVVDLLASWKEYKLRVPVCGCILLNPSMTKVLMVRGWNSKSWGFPKGKVNKDEHQLDCAVREVLEETGYDAHSAGTVSESDFLEVTARQQTVRLYIVPGVPEDTCFETRTRKEIRAIEWHKLTSLPTSFGGKAKRGYFLVVPFVKKLKTWIKGNRKRFKQGDSDGSRSYAQVAGAKTNQGGVVGRASEAEDMAKRGHGDTFRTDSQITGHDGVVMGRELQAWEPDSDDDSDAAAALALELDANDDGETWDQFEANRQLFGIRSTYDYEAYTVPLDRSQSALNDARNAWADAVLGHPARRRRKSERRRGKDGASPTAKPTRAMRTAAQHQQLQQPFPPQPQPSHTQRGAASPSSSLQPYHDPAIVSMGSGHHGRSAGAMGPASTVPPMLALLFESSGATGPQVKPVVQLHGRVSQDGPPPLLSASEYTAAAVAAAAAKPSPIGGDGGGGGDSESSPYASKEPLHSFSFDRTRVTELLQMQSKHE